jgi:hypothetical protein
LTRNTEFQAKWSSSQPPLTGPMAMPMPANPAQMPIALPSSRGGNEAVRIDSVDGMISAPPTPMSARAAISSPDPGASAASREPVPNTSNPAVSARRRPKRSPSEPAVSSSPANTSM